MEEARIANNSFPETEGWATIGEIIANIGRVGIPVAAGAAFAPAGIAAGIANVASSVAESHAQAQMELDNFEQETGQRLTDGQRTGKRGSNAFLCGCSTSCRRNYDRYLQ